MPSLVELDWVSGFCVEGKGRYYCRPWGVWTMKGLRGWAVLLVAGTLAVSMTGCGSTSPASGTGAPGELAIEEIGRILKTYQKGKNPAPKGLKDLRRFDMIYSGAIGALRKKEVLVYWGAGISDTSDAGSTILAYHKDVPEKGGEVLMQDGTARLMTAEEFKAAKKPEGATIDDGSPVGKKTR